MSVSAVVKDGKLVESTSEESLKSSSASSSNGMDKEAFLQLLVAQMKYQDPLEPTSNTEYISQYAQFSQVESIQNMASTSELQRASSLVGKQVSIETTTSEGNTKTTEGRVDYVVYENSKPYLSIDGSLYSLSDVVEVDDETYTAAKEYAASFEAEIDNLPNINYINEEDDADTIDALVTSYNSLTEYYQSFISDEYVEKLETYADKLAEIRGTSNN